jgi:uncharacterized phage-associated protein
MAYDPRSVANYFLHKAEDAGTKLTQMQIQKLVFFAHGWHLATLGVPLSTKIFNAWKWGPVNTQIYNKFKKFGALPIEGFAKDESGKEFAESFESATLKLLDEIYDNLSPLSGPQLSKETHKMGSPWDKVWASGDGEFQPIPDESLADYFKANYKNAA